MPWKVYAVKNGREIISDSTFQHRALAESYAHHARAMGAQKAEAFEVDDIEARKIKRAKASGL